MLPLPILNVHLQACSEDWQQMTPTAQGRHCAHCNHEVIDFTNSTAADLAAARAASPDGQLCGRFRQSQLAAAPQPRLRSKLRRFLVALVLVCGLGLSGREAWAQVKSTTTKQSFQPEVLGMYVEKMPEYPGGDKALRQFIASNVRYPLSATQSGRIWVKCRITKSGTVDSIRIERGLSPILDAEAIRVIQLMPCWTPGEQNDIPVDVYYTIPITFTSSTSSKNRK
ncbi:energy transducer TonB [Hymenobacter sp. NBH84]|nr:energy transducer TonB [Hymenobacter sp. NBH84]